MPNRLRYELPDGTSRYSLIYGAASTIPDATTTPRGAHYFASDTGQLSFCNGTAWVDAADADPPPDARVGTPGVVRVHRNASGSHPKVLTEDDLGAPNGVAQFDGSDLLPASVLPIANGGLGAGKQGTGIIIDSDGLAHMPSGGSGSFAVQHNSTTIATEAIIDFLASLGLDYTIVHDSAHNKVTITPVNHASMSLYPITSGWSFNLFPGINDLNVYGAPDDNTVVTPGTINGGSWQTLIQATVGVGVWLPYAYWQGSANAQDKGSFRVYDGTTVLGSSRGAFLFQGFSLVENGYSMAFPPVTVSSGTKLLRFQGRADTGTPGLIKANYGSNVGGTRFRLYRLGAP